MRKVKLMPWTNGGAASAPAPPVVRWQSTVKKCVEYRWTVDDFPTTADGDQPLESPLFPADDRPQWRLQIDDRVGRDADFVSLALILVASRTGRLRAQVTFAVVDAKERRVHETRFSESLEQGGRVGFSQFLGRKLLQAKDTTLLVNGALTVLCEIVTTDVSSSSDKPEEAVVFQEPEEAEDLGSLLESRTFCDVSIVVQGVEFQAHKLILAARSPVMASMFQQQMLEHGNQVVVVSDTEPAVFEALLRFVYTGRVEQLEERAEELLVLGHRYGLELLKMACEQHLVRRLGVANALRWLILADVHEAPRLRDRAVDFVNRHAAQVVDTPVWIDLVRGHPHLLADLYVHAMVF